MYFGTVFAILTVVYFSHAGVSKIDERFAVVPEDDFKVRDQPAISINKVEVVHKALEELSARELQPNRPVHPDENKAQEEYEDEKMYEEVAGNSNDSNQANEKQIVDAPAKPKSLPLKDGGLVFRGPSNERQKAVVDAFKHAWKGYEAHAWGHDHLRPISKGAQNWFGLGLTLIDSLDTLLIMNLHEEFDRAKGWVANSLSFSINKVCLLNEFLR